MTGDEVRARTPRGSGWDALAWWLDHDAEPLRDVDRAPASLAHWFLTHCCLPVAASVVARRVEAFCGDGIRPVPTAPSRSAIVDRLDAWSLAADPDHSELSELLEHARAHFDAAPPEPELPDEVRAWLRLHWMRGDGVWDDHVDPGLREALSEHAFSFPHPADARRAWLPSGRVPAREPDPEALEAMLEAAAHRRVVLGISGAAAAGKSTLARELAARAEARGLQATVVPGDAFTRPGEGFRYEHRGGVRNTHLHGPGIYDAQRLAERIDAVRSSHALGIVIVESVYTGCYPQVASRLDHHLVLRLPDRERLERKIRRDRNNDDRRFDLVRDFARKQYDEVIDVIDAGLC